MVYFLAIFLAASAYGAENPFSVEIVNVTATPDTASSVHINVIVPLGCHVYREPLLHATDREVDGLCDSQSVRGSAGNCPSLSEMASTLLTLSTLIT
jgi:hypothetical protein